MREEINKSSKGKDGDTETTRPIFSGLVQCELPTEKTGRASVIRDRMEAQKHFLFVKN